MTVKFFCAVAIIFSCSYIGIKLSDCMRKRVRSLTEILSAIGHIESCISTVRMPLSEIYRTLSETKGRVGELFSKVKPGVSWKDHLTILSGLSEKDKELISGLSEKLGAFESERQLDEIKLVKNTLSESLLAAKKDVAENSRTYRAMSFFTGVVIAILLI